MRVAAGFALQPIVRSLTKVHPCAGWGSKLPVTGNIFIADLYYIKWNFTLTWCKRGGVKNDPNNRKDTIELEIRFLS